MGRDGPRAKDRRRATDEEAPSLRWIALDGHQTGRRYRNELPGMWPVRAAGQIAVSAEIETGRTAA